MFVRVGTYPYGPLCIFLITLVLLLICAKRFLFGKEYDVRQYVGSLSIPMVLCGTGVFVWWVVWTNQGPKGYSIWSPSVDDEYVDWSLDTKLHYASRIECEPEDDLLKDDANRDVLDDIDDPYVEMVCYHTVSKLYKKLVFLLLYPSASQVSKLFLRFSAVVHSSDCRFCFSYFCRDCICAGS